MNKKYLLDNHNLDLIQEKIDEAENILLFLDYDGTLAPFKAEPLSAFALPEIITSLKKLEKSSKYYLSLVSGRKLSELKNMIDLRRSNYAGSHGLEIELFFREDVVYPHQSKRLDELSRKSYQKIKEKYIESETVKLEDKGFGFALHIDSESKQKEIERKLKLIFEKTAYQLLSGRKIIEVRPEGWDKGKAVDYITNQIRDNLDLENILRIYIGDDRTDEDAFKVLEDGIRIYVKNEAGLTTEADYYLNDPGDTAKLLKKLAGEL